jgi:transcriptional regulator with XRE-family HTH domain
VPRGVTRAREASDLDKLVGHNIRIQRLDRGMTQTELARAIGVSFQQIQKYENGVNRIVGGRLFKIAETLRTPVSTLFEGGDQAKMSSSEESPVALLAQPYALRFLQAFSQIEDSEVQRTIVEMAETLAEKLRRPAAAKGRKQRSAS